MIEFTGPAFDGVDNRLMSLELVQPGLTHAAMFGADGRVVQPSDALYKKCVLVERGSFRPATKVTVDMLRCAQAQFVQEPGVQGEDVVDALRDDAREPARGADEIDAQDFLDRADILATLGRTVLISNYGEYHRLAAYLFRQTKKLIGIVMGVPTLRELFDEKLLRRPRRRHPGVVRAAVQERPEDLRLPAARREDGRAHHRRQPPRRAAPAAPLRVSRGEPPDREHARLRRALPADLLARRARADPQRRPALGRDDAARRGRAHQESRPSGLPGDESGRRGGLIGSNWFKLRT